MGKKKRPNPVVISIPSVITLDNESGLPAEKVEIPAATQHSEAQQQEVLVERTHCFKNPKWVAPINRGTQVGFSGGNTAKRSKSWKSLKQIAASERSQVMGIPGCSAVLYGSLEAGTTVRYAKKYSDISGLLAKYTDPETKLRYANAKEFRKIRLISPDLVQGYLSLRRANLIV